MSILKEILSKLEEMTMKAGNLDAGLKKVFDHYDNLLKDCDLKHVGDIDDVKVMRSETSSDIIDLFVKGDKRIGIMVGKDLTVNHELFLELNELYIISEEQRKGFLFKYLYFLKNVMKHKLMFGTVHSSATQEFIKKQDNLKRFNVSWYNIDTLKQEPFKNSKYSLIGPTKWRVIIESDEISTFNQYKSSDVGIKNTYEWLFNNIDKQ